MIVGMYFVLSYIFLVMENLDRFDDCYEFNFPVN